MSLWMWLISICTPTSPKTWSSWKQLFWETPVVLKLLNHCWWAAAQPGASTLVYIVLHPKALQMGVIYWKECTDLCCLFTASLSQKKKKMDLVGVSCPDSAIAQALKRWSYHHKDHLNWMLCGRQWNLPEVGCCWRKDVTECGTVALRTYSPAHLLFILCFLWMAAMWALSFLLWQPAAMPSPSIWTSPLEL